MWKSFNRCVTVHGTNNARVEGNVCYDHLGHGYFLEDGAETGNLIAGNLGLGTRTATAEGVLPTDNRAATFWITNPDNTIRGNAAAGSDGLRLLVRAARLAHRTLGRQPAAAADHAAARVQRQRGPLATGAPASTSTTGRCRTATPRRPSTRRGPIPANANTAVVADFTGFTAYKHSGRAVWLRGRDHRLTNAVLADNAIGATFASSETFVEDALFVGESAQQRGRLSSGTPRRGLRVLRRPGRGRPGDLRQLHRGGLDPLERARVQPRTTASR